MQDMRGNDIQSLDKELIRLQKSTRTVIPAMLPLHDVMRQKYRWYYNWSMFPLSKYLHFLILIVFLALWGTIFYHLFIGQPQPVLAASTTVNPTSNNVPIEWDYLTGAASHWQATSDAVDTSYVYTDYAARNDWFNSTTINNVFKITQVDVTLRAQYSSSLGWKPVGQRMGANISMGGAAQGVKYITPTSSWVDYTLANGLTWSGIWGANSKTLLLDPVSCDAATCGAGPWTNGGTDQYYQYTSKVSATVTYEQGPTATSSTVNSDRSATVNWTDNSTTETKYNLYKGGVYDTFTTTGAGPDTGARSYSYSNSLTPGTAYTFGVTSADATYESDRQDASAVTTANHEQSRYRIGNDDGTTPTDHTWKVAENLTTNITQGQNFRARVQMKNTGGSVSNTPRLKFATTLGGAYSTVSATCAGNAVCVTGGTATDGTSFAPGLTSPGGTAVNGNYEETSSDATAVTIGNNYYSEFEWNVQVTGSATPGQAYYFRAYFNNNDAYNTYTNTLYVTALQSPPIAPSNGYVDAASTGGMTVHWTDNSSDETNFHLERQTDCAGSWGDVSTTIPADSTSYADSGLTANGSYCYRVHATNAGGDSGYTNTARGSTLATKLTPNSTLDTATTFRLQPSTAKLTADKASGSSAATFTRSDSDATYSADSGKPQTVENSNDGRIERVTTTDNSRAPGDGVRIEEARTNLVVNSSFENRTGNNFDNWGEGYSGSSTVTAETTDVLHSATSAKLTIDASNSAANLYEDSVTVTGSTTYTLSFYHKETGSCVPNLLLNWNNGGTNYWLQSDKTTWSTNYYTWVPTHQDAWGRYAITFTTDAGQTNYRISELKRGGGCTSQSLYFDAVQLEAGAFATSYIPTGAATATRNAESLSYVGASNLNPAAFTASTWFNSSAFVDGTNNYYRVFELYQDASNYLRLYKINNVRRIYMDGKTNGGTAFSLQCGTDISQNTWYHAAVAFTANTSVELFLNGSSCGSTSTNVTAFTGTPNIYPGVSNAGTLPLNGLISDFTIFNTALDSDTVTGLYNGYGPSKVAITSPPTVQNQLTVTWQDNSGNEDAAAGFTVENKATATCTDASGWLGTTTKVQNVITHDQGTLTANTQYCLHIRGNTGTFNSPYQGSAAAKYTLIEPISGITFSNITTTSITIAPTNTPTNLAAGSSGIQLKNTTNNTCQDGGACTAFQQSVTPWQSSGLSVNTTYNFTIQSRNGDGVTTTAYGPSAKYTLANAPIAATVAANSWDSSNGYSLTVTINANSNPASTEFAVSCDGTPTNWLQGDGTCAVGLIWKTKANWETGTVNYLKSLLGDTNYTVLTKARNGESTETSNSSGTTTMTAPAQVANLGHSTNTATSITWSWNANATAPDGYNIYEYTGGACTSTQKATTVHPNTTVAEGTLSVNTQYSRCAKAYRGAITGQPATNFAAYTSANAAGGPTVTTVSTTSTNIVIDKNGNPEGLLKSPMAVGSYVGDGVDGRQITGVGFQPDLVIIKTHAWPRWAVFRTSAMTGDSTSFFANGAANVTNYIQALLADGFELGTNDTVNGSGQTYHWMAFRDNGAGDFKVGSYLGNGADNRDITGLGFTPDLAVIKPNSTEGSATWRITANSGDQAMDFSFNSEVANLIQGFVSDGFQVGSSVSANSIGTTYWYFAFKVAAGFMAQGSYAGDNTDNRNITGVGFQPDLVWIKGTVYGVNGALRPSTITGDLGLLFRDSASAANFIQAMLADGFQVGTAQNASGTNYRWYAWKATAGGSSGGTEYAIACDAAGTTWLAANGASCGASKVWQNYAAWGGVSGKNNTGLGINTQHTYAVLSRNGDGDEATLSGPASKYTHANQPTAPTVAANSWDGTYGNSLTAVTNVNSNPANTEFAISCDNTPTNWLQNDGSCAAVKVWKTKANWEVGTTNYLKNLTADTDYNILSLARNGDNVDTANSTATGPTKTAPAQPTWQAGVTTYAPAVSTSSITWDWNDNAVSPDGYRLYNAATDNEVCAAAVPSTCTQTESSPGSPLQPNVSYQVKSQAYRGAITGQPSANVFAYTAIDAVSGVTWGTFTTTSLSGTPANTPSNLTAGTSGIQYKAYKVTGELLIDTSAWQQNVNSWTPAPALEVNTQYRFEIQSKNGDSRTTTAGTGLKYTRANAPITASHSAIATNSVTWTWNKNANPAWTEFYASDDSGINSGWVADGGSWVATTPAKNANTQYTVTAKARNGDSIDTDTIQHSAYTAIQTPTTITSGLITPNSIAITMNDVLTNLAVGSSGIQFGESSGSPGGGGEAAFTTWPQTTSTTDVGLVHGTQYRYKVKARNAEGVETTSYSPEFGPWTTTTGTELLFRLPGQNAFVDGANITGSPSNRVAGQEFSTDLYATDNNYYQDLNSTDTVALTSTDPQAVLPTPQLVAGVKIFNATFKTVGNQTITGIGSGGSSAQFAVVAGVCSASVSTAVAAPTSLNIGNTSTVTITLSDAWGNKLVGHTVSVSSDQGGDNITFSAPATDVNGRVLAYVTSNLPHTSTLTISETTDGVTLDTHPQIVFNAPAVANPTNFAVTPGDGQVTLTWTNPASFNHINIYRSTTSGVLGSNIKETSSTSYTDGGLSNGTTYFYTLKAEDAFGNESSGTLQLSAMPIAPTPSPTPTVSAEPTPTPTPTPADSEAPTVPSNLRATNVSSTTFDLAWDASSDNIGVAGYQLYNTDTNILIGITMGTTYSLGNLTPNTTYRFYLRAYDAAGNYSGFSNILTINTLKAQTDEEKAIEEQGGIVAYLVLGNVPAEVNSGDRFKDNVRVTAADAGGKIITGYTKAVYFSSTDDKAKLPHGKNDPYTFTSKDAGIHEFRGYDFALSTTGKQKITVSDYLVSNSQEVNVLGGKIIPPVLEKATDKVRDFFSKPSNVAKVNTGVVTTTTALLLIPLIVNTALSFSSILPQVLYWFIQLMQFFGLRKRRKPWGVVFNSQTGQVIALAIVRIYNKRYNKMLEQTVTDNQGRYGFLVREGSFYITCSKAGFKFPSKSKASSFYEKVYSGGEFKVSGEDQTIAFNIPLDPHVRAGAMMNFWIFLVRLNNFLQKLRLPLLSIGIVFAIVMMIIDFDIIYVLSLVFYLFIGLLEYLRTRKARPYGVVSDVYGHPISISIVRIYQKQNNRLIETDVTDNTGRFKFLVNPGVYYVTATKPGYIDYKSHLVYLEKEKTLVSTNIKLKKETK